MRRRSLPSRLLAGFAALAIALGLPLASVGQAHAAPEDFGIEFYGYSTTSVETEYRALQADWRVINTSGQDLESARVYLDYGGVLEARPFELFSVETEAVVIVDVEVDDESTGRMIMVSTAAWPAGEALSFSFGFRYAVEAQDSDASQALLLAARQGDHPLVSSMENCQVAPADSRCAEFPVDAPPYEIGIQKSASVRIGDAGETVIDYRIVASNDSFFHRRGDRAGVVIDDLADVLSHGSLAGAPQVTAGQIERVLDRLRWTVPIDQGSQAVLTYSVLVPEHAGPEDLSLVNTARSFRSAPSGSTEILCSDGEAECARTVTAVAPAPGATPTPTPTVTGTSPETTPASPAPSTVPPTSEATEPAAEPVDHDDDLGSAPLPASEGALAETGANIGLGMRAGALALLAGFGLIALAVIAERRPTRRRV